MSRWTTDLMDYSELENAILDGVGAEAVSGWVTAELAGVAAGRRSTTAVRHPLGFLCLPLLRAGGRGVCVHLWTRTLARAYPTTSPAHAHSWDLVSYVLYGEVQNELVQVRDSPRRATHRIFEVRSDGDTDEILATGRLVRWDSTTAELTPGGQTYLLPAGEFHMTVIPHEAETATIALGRTRAGAADLSLGGIDTGSHRVRRQRCTAAETAWAARSVARRLAVARMG
jgi:hypothetical protein